jgi:nitroreductase
MNNVIEALKHRRSIRKYKSDEVSEDLLNQIVEAGEYAASGKGQQAVITLTITNKELRDELSRDNCLIGGWKEDFDPFYGAPAVIVVLANKERPTYVYDGSLVMGNLMQAADALGLGSCWIHRAKEEFEMDKYKKLLLDLGIEGEYEGIGHCIIGYPDQEVKAAPRKKRNYVIK